MLIKKLILSSFILLLTGCGDDEVRICFNPNDAKPIPIVLLLNELCTREHPTNHKKRGECFLIASDISKGK